MTIELVTMKGDQKPRYRHACWSCIYLGSCVHGGREVHDLYYCRSQLVVVRSNNAEHDIGHFVSVLRAGGRPDFAGFHPSVEAAYRLAEERKLI